jgi:hypothetical protein
MLALLWNLSAAIRGYLRFYMPTNRALDWLRTPRGLKWAIPISAVVTPSFLYATSVAAVIAAEPGLGWMNVLVILFLWNALKFAWAAVLAPLASLRMMLARSSEAASQAQCVLNFVGHEPSEAAPGRLAASTDR